MTIPLRQGFAGQVRDATEADIPRLLELGARFWEVAGWGPLTGHLPGYVPDDVALELRQHIASQASVLLTDGAHCCGLLRLFPLDVNKAALAAKIAWWWVEPEARGMLGIRLFEAMETRARQAGAAMILASAAVDMKGKSVGRFLERQGFAVTDINYAKGLG